MRATLILLVLFLHAGSAAGRQVIAPSREAGASFEQALAGDGGRPAMGPLLRRRIPEGDSLWAVALRIHFDAVVVDGHADTPTLMTDFGYDLGARHRSFESHIDLPRMREGGLDAAFFSIWVPTGYGEGRAAYERARTMIAEVRRQVALYPADAGLAASSREVVSLARAGKRAILLGLEGAHALAGREDLADSLFEAGIRYITLTHVRANSFADASQSASRWGGLSNAGHRLVQRLNRLGILIDLSHVSDKTAWDVLEISRAPVILSHSSARALTDHVRNVNDDLLRGVAASGGVAMVNFYDLLVNREPGLRSATLEDVIAHIDHVARTAGIEHVGLGSDFDGARMPSGLEDVTLMPWITRGLLELGYDERALRLMLGGNVLRVLDQARALHDMAR